MGRHKIERETAPEKSIQFIKGELKQYRKHKELCDRIENTRPGLLASAGIAPELFESDSVPTPQMFPMMVLPLKDAKEITAYLEAKESVYIIEHGIAMIEDELTRAVVTKLYCHKLTWEEIIRQECVSRMTLCRARNKGLTELALWADSYLLWKVKMNIFV